jgi:hypothetical protein
MGWWPGTVYIRLVYWGSRTWADDVARYAFCTDNLIQKQGCKLLWPWETRTFAAETAQNFYSSYSKWATNPNKIIDKHELPFRSLFYHKFLTAVASQKRGFFSTTNNYDQLVFCASSNLPINISAADIIKIPSETEHQIPSPRLNSWPITAGRGRVCYDWLAADDGQVLTQACRGSLPRACKHDWQHPGTCRTPPPPTGSANRKPYSAP